MLGKCVVALVSAMLGQTSDVTYVSTINTDVVYPARLTAPVVGGLYVTDPTSNFVYQFSPAGALVSSFVISQGPIGIAAHPDGRVFVSRRDGLVGVYTSAFVAAGTVNPAPMTMTEPNDLAYDAVAGELYVVDAGGDQVLVFHEVGGAWVLDRAWGISGGDLGQLHTPQAIAVDPVSGNVIMTDTDNFRMQVFDRLGVLLFKFGYRLLYTVDGEIAWMPRSEGVAVDACSNIYVTDAVMGTVRVFDSLGQELDENNEPAVGYGTGPGQLRVPGDVLINGTGMYVADTNNGAVQVYTVACTAAAQVATMQPSTQPQAGRDPAGKRGFSARESSQRRYEASRTQFPDDPSDIVRAIWAGEYCEDYDLNRDGRMDRRDLEMSVQHFGVGTVQTFVDWASVQTASHDILNEPHIIDIANRCGRCHGLDGTPGGTLLKAEGQENLCLSCHSAGKIAGSEWVGPGSDANSHPWGLLADAGISDGPPVGSEMSQHLDAGKVRCGTCHNPHGREGTNDYMRMEIYETINVTVTGLTPPAPRPMVVMDPTLCGQCHTDIADQWHVAGHSHEDAEALIHYDWSASNRASCRKCHSGFGYIDYLAGVPEASRRGNLRTIDCLVCHSTHGAPQSSDLLRGYGSVVMPGNVTLNNVGASATCMNCHNGRNAVADPGFTPHYLLGGAMLAGVNGITTFRGVAYTVTSSQHTTLMNAGEFGCQTCHMAPSPAPGNPGAGKVGGHTFRMEVDDPGAVDDGFENVANACGGCHTGLTTFNRMARGDYDGDGTTEGVQDETRGLMELVVSAIEATGAQQLLDAQGQPTYPYWRVAQCVAGPTPGATCTSNSGCGSGGTCVTVINPPADRPVVEDAIWNWEFVDNSSDHGVKNTGYAIGLLQITYEALTGAPLNAYLRYTPTGQTASLQYTGTDSCLTCHGAAAVTGTDYSSFLRSGHPYKLSEVIDGQMPTFPHSSIAGALAMVADNDAEVGDPNPGTDNTLPTPTSYADVSYVIGGFGWKARWVDLAGYIVTGTATQFNLATGGMSAYNNNQVDKKYDCGSCHTTGWRDYTSGPGDTRNLNRQKNLPGMAGTWYDEGVHCEACHGAGSVHVEAPSTSNITKVATARSTADMTAADMAYGKPMACMECHTRDGEKLYPSYVPAGNRIKASGGFIQHHEQYDEMVGINPDDVPGGPTGPHAELACTDCHNAHTTTKYQSVSGDAAGMYKACTECHNPTGIGAKDFTLHGTMANVNCVDCHMPYLVKSAVSYPAVGTGPSQGDIRSHIAQIDLTNTNQYTAGGAYAYPWVTGQYACAQCHNGVTAFGLAFPDFVTEIHDGTH